ncbi:hypothetical protein EGK75_07410 [Neisseria weixii]|uniref:Uncharacterized protein n=1 Tax=Neisseria weixii TaxID=1853276 RepID=A0A3N4NG87_9NEIS|nr:hypothetical protein [Neisseria weixii]RPD86203.1 hypothetical protein EGK74_08125 [Neisseria weixii]RPD87186.1 hypothetical protein EGK75_07410 [Neisseria weixii]
MKKGLIASALGALGALRRVLGENESVWEVPRSSDYYRHTGKGCNKQPHRFSGVAAAKRAARKRKNKG